MGVQPNEFIPTRQSLLARIKDLGDQESWHDFFNTYWKLIYGVAIQSGLSEPEAEDIVQETLIAVSKAIPEFEYEPEVCSFKSWLRLLVRRRIADRFRKRGRELPAEAHRAENDTGTAEIERLADPAGSEADATWEREWQKTLIDVALERLKRQVKPEQYQIFYLLAVKQLPPRDVAKALGVNIGRVYLVKHRLAKPFQNTVKELAAKLV